MKEKDDQIYLLHILEAIEKIESYTANKIKKEFLTNSLLADGVVRQIQIIGEATKHISKKFRSSNPAIPWQDIAGMRDKLVHDYLGVDLDSVWETVKKDLPVLKRHVLILLKRSLK